MFIAACIHDAGFDDACISSICDGDYPTNLKFGLTTVDLGL